MIPPAVRDLVGRAYGDPYDCGTLAAEVLRQYGVDLGEIPEREPDEILGAIARLGFERVGVPANGDLLLFRLPMRFAGSDTHYHVGVVVDSPLFVHAVAGHGVLIHSAAQPFWARALVSAYRRA